MVLVIGCTSNRLLKEEPVSVAVEHLLQSIDQAIDRAYSHHRADMELEVMKVSVLLETVVDKDSSQDITISVLEIEAAEEETVTQALTLELEPPKKSSGATPTAARAAQPRLIEDLVLGIDAAFLAARGAKAGLESLHPDGIPLEAKKITVAVSFAVTSTGEGLPSITILGVNLTAQRSKQHIHTVTMVFEITDAA